MQSLLLAVVVYHLLKYRVVKKVYSFFANSGIFSDIPPYIPGFSGNIYKTLKKLQTNREFRTTEQFSQAIMSERQIIITGIPLDDILKYDKAKYNSNNHWENDIRPADYGEVLDKDQTKHWVDKFRDASYHKIIIDDTFHLEWMQKAGEICHQTGKFSKLFEDELDLFIQQVEPRYKHILDGKTKYFVRAENVSLKCGQHKAGPYYTLRQIIESTVSCIHGHRPFSNPNMKQLTLYLLPWVEIEPQDEFRVFVYQGKITAISQQCLYQRVFPAPTLDMPLESLHAAFIKKIQLLCDYFESDVKRKISWTDSLTYDFAFLRTPSNVTGADAIEGVKVKEDDEVLIPFFIEPNCFGKEYAAGSSLFHWLLDESILYQTQEPITIHFRYTI